MAITLGGKSVSLQNLPERFQRRPISRGRDQHVQHLVFTVDRAPKITLTIWRPGHLENAIAVANDAGFRTVAKIDHLMVQLRSAASRR